MQARTDVANVTRSDVQAAPRVAQETITLRPPVDIFETSDGITVQAELPGVSKERLNVQADRNSLVIEGDVTIDMPEGMSALYADVQATRFRRSFTLSGELDTDHIQANLKDGVLTLHIPKRAEFKPRRIEVQAS